MQNVESKNPFALGKSGHIIVSKRDLNPQVTEITVVAPEIAEKAQAGQFVILRIDEEGERIPLTLFEWSCQKALRER